MFLSSRCRGAREEQIALSVNGLLRSAPGSLLDPYPDVAACGLSTCDTCCDENHCFLHADLAV